MALVFGKFDNADSREVGVMLERLIAAIEVEAQAQTVKDERFVREQRILDEAAPRIWKSLRDALKVEAGKYPKHFTFEVQPDTEVIIRGAKVLEAEFLTESKAVVFRCGEVEGECVMRLDAQNRAVICDSEAKPYPSVGFVAEWMLSLILQ